MGQVMVDEECAPQVGGIRVRSVQLRELEERLRQQLYAIHEIIDETKTETVEHGAIVENWMHLVTSTVEPDRCIARRDSQEGWTAVGIMRLYKLLFSHF